MAHKCPSTQCVFAEAAGFQPPGRPAEWARCTCGSQHLAHTAFLLPFPLHRSSQRKCSLGKPDQRELSENLAATQGLAHMIMECNRLFQVCHLL